jgi:hypothetical protein
MKKYIIASFFMAATLCFAAAQQFSLKNAEGQTIKYQLYDDGSGACVMGPKGKKYKAASLTLPSTVEYQGKSYKVKGIFKFAFVRQDAIREITLPEGLLEVGQSCFEDCDLLEKAILPRSLEEISYQMFAYCPNLTEVLIPYNSEIKSIGGFAFDGCRKLASFNISEKVVEIGQGPWRGCTSLEQINVAADNPNFKSVGGVLFNKKMSALLQYPAGRKDAAYKVPFGVSRIANSAFYECDNLRKVVLPGSLMYIEHLAFYGCRNLSEVYVPDMVQSIGNGAFFDCNSLKNITIKKKTNFTVESDPTSRYNSFLTTTFVNKVASVPVYVEPEPAPSATAPSSAPAVRAVPPLKVDNLVLDAFNVSGAKYKRLDLNDEPCALIIVAYPSPGAVFSGNIIGDVEFKVNEYWVYVSPHTRFLKIQAPGQPSEMIDFRDYGFTSGAEPTATYSLTFLQ